MDALSFSEGGDKLALGGQDGARVSFEESAIEVTDGLACCCFFFLGGWGGVWEQIC